MRLLNDNFENVLCIFYTQRKGVGTEQARRERESERIERERDRVWHRKGCSMGHNLDCQSSYYDGNRDRDNPRLYQDGNINYHTDLDGQYFLYERYNFSSI